MAEENVLLNFKSNFKDVGIKQVTKELGRMNKEFQTAKTLSKQLGMTGKNFKTLEKGISNARKEAGRFKAEFLSLLFGGMAMQRFFGGFITDAFRTFNTITEGTQLANNSVNQLKAAWEFFKFSLISALQTSPLFQQLVKWVIQLVDWFSSLSPATQRWIAWIAIVLAGIGALLMIIGQMVLGWIGVAMVFGPIIKSVWAFIKGMHILKLLFTGLKLVWGILSKALITGLKFLVTNPFALLILAILAVIVVFLLLKKKFGTWQNALKAWAAALVLAVALVFHGLVFIVKEGLDLVLGGVQAIIRGVAKAASFLGMGKTASMLNSAADALQGFRDMKIDVVGKAAELLDSNGFNPEPVKQEPEAAQTGNTFNITQLNVETLSGQGGIEEELERSGQYYGFGN